MRGAIDMLISLLKMVTGRGGGVSGEGAVVQKGGRNVLLYQQLHGIGQENLANPRTGLTGFALKGLVSDVGDGYQATLVADMYTIEIAVEERALLHQLGSTMSYYAITLHFPKA